MSSTPQPEGEANKASIKRPASKSTSSAERAKKKTKRQADNEKIEKELQEKMRKSEMVEVAMSIIIGSQSTAEIIVGNGQKTNSFRVPKDLLILYSDYFRDLFVSNTKIKEEVKTEIKAKEEPDQFSSSPLREMSFESVHFMHDGTPPLESQASTQTLMNDLNAPAAHEIADVVHRLPDIEPSDFAIFIHYIHQGELLIPLQQLAINQPDIAAGLWALGATIRSASFQNHIMNNLGALPSVTGGSWPTGLQASHIWAMNPASTVKGEDGTDGLFKKFAIDCIAANAQLQSIPADSKEYTAWGDFFQHNPSVSVEVMRIGCRWWGESKPWDMYIRGDYLVSNEGVGARWEKMILMKISREEIQIQKDRGCVKSMLEERHLEKMNKATRKEIV